MHCFGRVIQPGQHPEGEHQVVTVVGHRQSAHIAMQNPNSLGIPRRGQALDCKVDHRWHIVQGVYAIASLGKRGRRKSRSASNLQ